ncbi:MAG TPA: protein kinase, partial [Burkholderiales bacterium]|nr:protein kinase [Burkholderiales bacterium]
MTEDNILARYTIQRELGRGALGAVYAARDRTTGTVVALKRLDPALFSKADASFAERFLQQARAARRLEHAGIVRVLDAGAAAGTGYVAMELLEGESLRSILDRGPLPL